MPKTIGGARVTWNKDKVTWRGIWYLKVRVPFITIWKGIIDTNITWWKDRNVN